MMRQRGMDIAVTVASFALQMLVVVALAVISVVGNDAWYTSPMMIAAWTVLCSLSIYLLWRKGVCRRVIVLSLHLSLVMILVGAAVTHFTSSQGELTLRMGETKTDYVAYGGKRCELPFSVRLDSFAVVRYVGSDAPRDYRSFIDIDGEKCVVQMNHTVERNGYRLYQTSYDEDMRGSLLSVTYDPYGETITYAAYIMLLISIIAFFISKGTAFRALLRSDSWRTFGVVTLLFVCHQSADALPRTFSRAEADAFGNINILYQGRVTQMETYALDFTRKLCGSSSYKGLSATQVLSLYALGGHGWQEEPMIKVGGERISYADALRLITSGRRGKIVDEADEKLGLIIELRQGTLLKVFPQRDSSGAIAWYDPSSSDQMREGKYKQFASVVFPLFFGCVSRDEEGAVHWMKELKGYQRDELGALTSDTYESIERFYDRYCRTAPLAYASLTLGIVTFVLLLISLIRKSQLPIKVALRVVLGVLLVLIAVVVSLRSYIAGRLPLSNGYETMLLIALLSAVIGFVGSKRFAVVLPFAFLISGFALLVSTLSIMNPQITPLMPVLASPWLSIHVSLMMISYTLYGFTAICSILSLTVYAVSKDESEVERLALLNRVVIYPATFLLTIGIFIGAVWANASWGSYWSWDPKETWALITMLLYSFTFHLRLTEGRVSAVAFQIYVLLCFLAILMTYFGVNYILGGMHSYA